MSTLAIYLALLLSAASFETAESTNSNSLTAIEHSNAVSDKDTSIDDLDDKAFTTSPTLPSFIIAKSSLALPFVKVLIVEFLNYYPVRAPPALLT